MAIYDFDLGVIRRSAGHSAVHEAAYITGQRLLDERTGLVHNFQAKRGILGYEVIGPSHMDPGWFSNQLEARERRSNSVTARKIKMALPHEFTDEQRWQALRQWAIYVWENFRFGSLISQHGPPTDPWSSGLNDHGHQLLSTRAMDATGNMGPKARDWDVIATSHLIVRGLREMWARIVNRALEIAGFAGRVDHRSLKDRGSDRLAKRHLRRGEYIASVMGRARSNYARENHEITAHNEKQQQQLTTLQEKIDAQRDAIRHRANRAIDLARRAVDSGKRGIESGKRAIASAAQRIAGAARATRIAQFAIDEYHRRQRGGPPALRRSVDQTLDSAGDNLSAQRGNPYRRDSDRSGQQRTHRADRRADAELRPADQPVERGTSSEGEAEKTQDGRKLSSPFPTEQAEIVVELPELLRSRNREIDATWKPRPSSIDGRRRLADALSLELRTIRAFVGSSEADEHGGIIFPHGRHGEAEVYDPAGYSFRGGEESGSRQGRSIWFGHPPGHQPATLIMIAPFVCDALAAWQALGDPDVQTRTVLVSTAGEITQTGLDRFTKLVRTVHGAQRVRGRSDSVTVVDLNGTAEDEMVGHSEALVLLAQTLGVMYLRSKPPQETSWHKALCHTDKEMLGTDENPTAAISEDPPTEEVGYAETEDARENIQDDEETAKNQPSASESPMARRPRPRRR